MKKLSCILALIIALSVSIGAKIGDITDYVLFTDIITYIDGLPIQSYNINGNTAVIAESLDNYGFDVLWNAEKRSLSITRDLNETIKGGDNVKQNTEKIGSRAMPVLETDIITYIENAVIKSYNINGQTIVYVDDIAIFADTYVYDNDSRTLSLKLSSDKTIPQPAIIDEKPIISDPVITAPVIIEPIITEPVIEKPVAVNTLTLVNITTPVRRNEYAQCTIQGKPNTRYSITVFYKSGAATADGLESKYSDANGFVTWEWKIGGKTTLRDNQVTISGGGETIKTTITTIESK
jgi:hypothetical protein